MRTPEHFCRDVLLELARADAAHPALHSAHEAYAVLLEEVEEFKAEVWKQREARDRQAMYVELVQVAAVAARAVRDLGLEEGAP